MILIITNNTFAHSGKKTVPGQIIHSVHIQLSAHQLVKKSFGIIIPENGNGCIQGAVEFLGSTYS